jgi:ribosomal protein S6--L-glutamate ligase
VVLAETQKAAESVIDAFRELDANFLVQQFVREAGGADIRAFVVGDRVVASMLRQAKEGEFRSNLHRGGSASVVKLSPQERATAVSAAKTIGLNVAGVDIVRSKDGPLVLEVNSSPGLEGIEGTTGKDVAAMVIAFLEKRARPDSTRTRGKG